jgi:hypothetical protein
MRRPGSAAVTGALALLLALAPRPSAAADDDVRALWRENRRLAAEVELAKGPKSYFVLDLGARTAALRVRGMTLAEWPLEKALVWGKRLRTAPLALERKDALPRPAVVPGEEKSAANLDAQILEVGDMPAAYRVGLEGNVEIRVIPAPGASLREGVLHAARLLRWRLLRPLRTLEDRRSRREATYVLLVLRADDARAVYWSFYEGIKGIVLPP